MPENGCKHVQTELAEDVYEAFHDLALERGLTLNEAVHEAIISWIERQRRPDPNDRAFTVFEELDDKSLPASAKTDARHEADLVDEWAGDDVGFTLADDPPTSR